MGLREINAARTKAMIVDAAMELFFTDGYDATTMEDIAERTGISTSTLYRYFGTKEAVAIGFLGDPGLMADEFVARPRDESVEIALGHALIAFLEFVTVDLARAEKFNEMIQSNPRPRAHLGVWLDGVQTGLIHAIAERSGVSEDDVHVAATAWMAIFVIQHAVGLAGVHPGGGDSAEAARKVMQDLARQPVVSPRV